MNTKSRRSYALPKETSATNLRNFRTFLLMQQFAAAEIGARIAEARKLAGAMTQEELAEALNVSTRSVQDYEAGKTIPWKHFHRLEQIFKRQLEWFLHGDQEVEPATAGEASTASLLRRLEALEAQVAALPPATMVQEGFVSLERAIDEIADRLSPPGAQEA